jgi:hypothetical protein
LSSGSGGGSSSSSSSAAAVLGLGGLGGPVAVAPPVAAAAAAQHGAVMTVMPLPNVVGWTQNEGDKRVHCFAVVTDVGGEVKNSKGRLHIASRFTACYRLDKLPSFVQRDNIPANDQGTLMLGWVHNLPQETLQDILDSTKKTKTPLQNRVHPVDGRRPAKQTLRDFIRGGGSFGAPQQYDADQVRAAVEKHRSKLTDDEVDVLLEGQRKELPCLNFSFLPPPTLCLVCKQTVLINPRRGKQRQRPPRSSPARSRKRRANNSEGLGAKEAKSTNEETAARRSRRAREKRREGEDGVLDV